MVDGHLGRIEAGAVPANAVPRARPRRQRDGHERDGRDFASELESKPPRTTPSELGSDAAAKTIRRDLAETGRGIDVVA